MPDGIVFKGLPLILSVSVPVPPGYLGDITIEFVNKAYESEEETDLYGFEFCDAAVISSGSNVPCLRAVEDVSVEKDGGESKVFNG